MDGLGFAYRIVVRAAHTSQISVAMRAANCDGTTHRCDTRFDRRLGNRFADRLEPQRRSSGRSLRAVGDHPARIELDVPVHHGLEALDLHGDVKAGCDAVGKGS